MRNATAGLSWALAVGTAAWTNVSVAEDLPMLCPQPQEARLVPGEESLGLSADTVLRIPSGCATPIRLAAERLTAALGRLGKQQQAAEDPATVCIGCTHDSRTGELRGLATRELMDGAEQLPAEGYLLRTSAAGAIIVGKDTRGAVYGVETLLQLLRRGLPVPALEIRDYPDTAWRMTYCAGGERLDERIRRIVGLCVSYKLNLIVFENGGFYQLQEPAVRERLLEVFRYCEDMGIEPVPELQSFGWSQFILPLDPLCVEAMPMRDRHFQFDDEGVAQPWSRPAADLTLGNGNLDQAEGHRIADWQQDDTGATIFSEPAETGGKCLKIQRTVPGQSRVYQRLRCEADTVYELQVDMRTDAGKGFVAYFEVYGFPSLERGREFVHYPHVSTTTAWERRSLLFRTGPATELVVYLRIQDGTGSAWFDNVAIRTAPELPMLNVVETPDQPIVVTSLDGKTKYRHGVDYAVEPGDLGYPFPNTARPWQLRRQPDGAIAPREQILVSYECAEPGDITYCPSEPRTQALMRRAIAETVQTFKPRLIHLGHDEPRVINRDGRCRARGLAAHELYVDDIRRMHQYVQEADPKCRLMIWADAFRVNEAGEVKVAWFSDEKCSLDDAVREVPREIILCPWRYTETDVDFLYRDLASLAAAGFGVTGSPWYDLGNAVSWGRAVSRLRAESDRCLGLFLTTWDDRWEALPLTSDLMWTLAKPEFRGQGESLARELESRYRGFDTFRP